MEDKKEKQDTKTIEIGTVALVGVFLIGYLLRGSRVNQQVTEAYRKGVIDTMIASNEKYINNK